MTKHCINCGREVAFEPCDDCEICYEVEGRLDAYMQSEHGLNFVRNHLAAAERERKLRKQKIHCSDTGKLTVVLPAKAFPNGTVVRKPLGNQLYTISQDFTFYGCPERHIVAAPEVRFLCTRNYVSTVDYNKQLAKDFPTLEEAQDFLRYLATQRQ